VAELTATPVAGRACEPVLARARALRVRASCVPALNSALVLSELSELMFGPSALLPSLRGMLRAAALRQCLPFKARRRSLGVSFWKAWTVPLIT